MDNNQVEPALPSVEAAASDTQPTEPVSEGEGAEAPADLLPAVEGNPAEPDNSNVVEAAGQPEESSPQVEQEQQTAALELAEEAVGSAEPEDSQVAPVVVMEDASGEAGTPSDEVAADASNSSINTDVGSTEPAAAAVVAAPEPTDRLPSDADPLKQETAETGQEELCVPTVEEPITPEQGGATPDTIDTPEADVAAEEEREIIPAACATDISALSERLNAGIDLQGVQQMDRDEDARPTQSNEHEQLNRLEYVASTMFAMNERVTELSKAVSALSLELQKVSDETERTVTWAESVKITSALSRWFLIVTIVVLFALLGGMAYLAVNQHQLQQQQAKVSMVAANAVDAQEKRLEEFNKHFAELVGGEIKNEREAISKDSIMSKLNKLRGGVAEQRILRKSNGDWLIPSGKTEELVTDHDTIEALNQAFEKSGRSLVTPPSIPPHKVVSILKPDGKGGTAVVVTRETVP